MTPEIIYILIGSIISIIGYFLKRTIEDLKDVKQLSYTTRNKLDVMENDYMNKHSHLSGKFDELNSAVKDLTTEIKQLTKEVQKKKDL